MTCIVGLLSGGQVYIGGDSAGTSDWNLTLRADPKVFRLGPFLFGFTWSYRMGQLLRYSLVVPERDPAIDAHHYMVARFIPAVRECLKAGGFARKENEQEEGGQFMVGMEGKLFVIDSDYQVGIPMHGYDAIGCGAQAALGALYATEGQEARTRVLTALAAAERFNIGVRRPFMVEVL